MSRADMTALLELRDVEARYGQIRALHGVSLRVDEGEIVSVLGANGAGKTTTLRAISGTVRRGGEIVFAGERLRRRPPEAYARRGPLAEDAERVFAFFPRLRERRDQQAGTLSGGEQQMLALGRAMMARPRLLLLDEPSLGLAPLVVQEIFAALRRMNDEDGLTVLVVEQNATLALEASQRAYVLEAGRGAA